MKYEKIIVWSTVFYCLYQKKRYASHESVSLYKACASFLKDCWKKNYKEDINWIWEVSPKQGYTLYHLIHQGNLLFEIRFDAEKPYIQTVNSDKEIFPKIEWMLLQELIKKTVKTHNEHQLFLRKEHERNQKEARIIARLMEGLKKIKEKSIQNHSNGRTHGKW